MISQATNLLAIEWDRNEVRYVWATLSGRRIALRNLGRIATVEGDPPETIESVLADLRGLLRLKNPQVVVTLARSEVEETEAALPPAQDHEIPHLVENQAHERWPQLADDAAIDYYFLENLPDGTRRVSIVVLSPEKRKALEGTLKAANWKITSLRMRHLSAVHLLRRHVELDLYPQAVLLSLGRLEAELVVMANDQIALVRSIPLSSEFDRDLLVEKLTVEIQRSLMLTAPALEATPAPPPAIFLWGESNEQTELAAALNRQLNLEISVLDPLQTFTKLLKNAPEQTHQFATLLGTLGDARGDQKIDLCQPKCARRVPIIYQRLALYSAAAAILVGVLVWAGYRQLSEIRDQNRRLRQDVVALEKKIGSLKKNTAVVDYVRDWRNDDINWLEELRSLTQRFPDRSEAQVKSMSMTLGPNRRGLISMSVRTKDDLVISKLEQSIRDKDHQVRTNQLSQNANDQDFPWQFGATILLNRRDKEDFSQEAAGAPAASSPDATGNTVATSPVAQKPEVDQE